MILTVTLNPAMDKTVVINNFQLGSVNRVSNIRYDIGGKGINVSKVLKNFKVDSICTGFLGGIWEKNFIEELNKRGIETQFVKIDGNTRTNTKIVDKVNEIYTDVNEAGPNINKEMLEGFIDEFKQMCNDGDIVVLSGGVSPNIPKNIYAKLIEIAKEKGALTILDADGELLKEGIKSKPDIIKPNNHELMKLLNLKNDSEEELIRAGKKLNDEGIEVLISLGEKGALYITKKGVYSAEGIKVDVKSTVGAGDSMVAAIIYSIVNNYSNEETLKFAVACGTSSVTLEGTEACNLEDVNKIFDMIKVVNKK
ncbi:1-phosphofructokinase [Haloimpatiens sp. FM7330]|uniref:1-phosphofructokinase n=1 Tax=Haloimpatiens sp. FM7330 TaxID=3298610 RepID=UPI00363F7490